MGRCVNCRGLLGIGICLPRPYPVCPLAFIPDDELPTVEVLEDIANHAVCELQQCDAPWVGFEGMIGHRSGLERLPVPVDDCTIDRRGWSLARRQASMRREGARTGHATACRPFRARQEAVGSYWPERARLCVGSDCRTPGGKTQLLRVAFHLTPPLKRSITGAGCVSSTVAYVASTHPMGMRYRRLREHAKGGLG